MTKSKKPEKYILWLLRNSIEEEREAREEFRKGMGALHVVDVKSHNVDDILNALHELLEDEPS